MFIWSWLRVQAGTSAHREDVRMLWRTPVPLGGVPAPVDEGPATGHHALNRAWFFWSRNYGKFWERTIQNWDRIGISWNYSMIWCFETCLFKQIWDADPQWRLELCRGGELYEYVAALVGLLRVAVHRGVFFWTVKNWMPRTGIINCDCNISLFAFYLAKRHWAF